MARSSLVIVLSAAALAASAAEVTTIRITPAEAEAKKLPRATIALSVKGLGLTVSKLPDATTYLRLSGPPGGPLGVIIRPFSGTPDAELVRSLAQKEIEKPFALAGPEEVRVGGRKLWGIAYAAAAGAARAQGCLLLYPAPPKPEPARPEPKAKAKPKADPKRAKPRPTRGVAVRFWTAASGSAAASCQVVLKATPFPKLFASLKLSVE